MDALAIQRLWVRLLIDDIASEILPSIAMSIVNDPAESSSLWTLATSESVTRADAVALVQKALEEAGLPNALDEAVRSYAVDVANQIVSGGMDAYEGARKIWRAARIIPIDDRYDPFIYAASEYEDRPEDREFFRAAIVEEAKRLRESVS